MSKLRLLIATIICFLSFSSDLRAQPRPPIDDSGMDLPIRPVKLGDKLDEPEPVGEPDEEVDKEEKAPRDIPPPVIYGEEILSESDKIVYVLDISCSMDSDLQVTMMPDGSLEIGTRLTRAKSELVKSIEQLSPNISFNVIAYSCAVRLWASGTKPATQPNKGAARSWTMSLGASGGTGTGPATAKALNDKDVLSVVLLTDGAPGCGATDIDGHRRMIRMANTQGATVDVFGISASGVYRAFCQAVASDSGGRYFDVP